VVTLRLLAATVKPWAVKAEVMLLAADCALAAMLVDEAAGTVPVPLVLVLAVAVSLRRLAAAVTLTQLAGETPRMVAMLLASVEALAATAVACGCAWAEETAHNPMPERARRSQQEQR